MPKQPSRAEYEQALTAPPTPFDKEFEQHLQRHEANYAKMREAQTGGSGDLAPSEMEQQQAKQTTALQRQATTQGAQQAQQAQAQTPPIQPPEAPGGAAGQTRPFPAQAGPQPAPQVQPPPSTEPPAPGAPPEEGEED